VSKTLHYAHFYAYLLSHEKRPLAASCPSVRLSIYISAAATGRNSVKFNIGDFYENMLRKVHMWLKSGKNMGNLREALSTFYCYWQH